MRTKGKTSAKSRTLSLLDGLTDLERPKFLGRDGALLPAKLHKRAPKRKVPAAAKMTLWMTHCGIHTYGDCIVRYTTYDGVACWRTYYVGAIICEGDFVECCQSAEEVHHAE